MSYLTALFPEAENNLYMHLGFFIRRDLSPDIDIVLDSAAAALGYSVEGFSGDHISRLLHAAGEADLAIELRAVITVFNSVNAGE